MIEYHVSINKSKKCFIINGPFHPNSIPIEIPNDNPDRKIFVDLFLHKADIERGIEFLQSVALVNSLTIKEGLFIAGLNNYMKCFKYSKSRTKLDKKIVFANNNDELERFIEFEIMRDKHFDHDENGMLQATAFLLICNEQNKIFGGPPSVVWSRSKLDYNKAAKILENNMKYVLSYLCQEIDIIGQNIIATYITCPKEKLLNMKTAKIQLATTVAKR